LDVEIHHVVPQAEGGPDSLDNAAPLCPSCHATYGANLDKRKFIREVRDFWYGFCAKRFDPDLDRPSEVVATLQSLVTKEDLERLAVQSRAYVLGAAGDPPWEYMSYSFSRPEFIHPLIVRELLGWLSDPFETVTSIDLSAANRSNRFYGEFSARDVTGRTWVRWESEDRGTFSYSHIATSASGVHIVECHDGGGGSGVFGSVALLALECDRALVDEAVGSISTRQRVLLKTLGRIGLGDRYDGSISYQDGMLVIGPDHGWFNRGTEACREIPVR